MHDITTQVLGVQQVPSRDGQSIKHEVSLAGGTAADGTVYPPGVYITFDPALSAKAFGLVNMPAADARVEIKQVPKRSGQGFFTNFNLEDIAVQGGLMPQAMPAPGGTPAQQPMMPIQQQQFQQPQPPIQQAAMQHQAQTGPPAPQPFTHPALAADEERKSQEQRGYASSTAFAYIGALAQAGLLSDAVIAGEAARQLTEDLISYRRTGSWRPDSPSDVSETQAPATPEELAQAANEELGEGAVQVGVPFDTPQQT